MKQFERTIEIDGKEIVIKYILGLNDKDNHQIIDDADQNDWWFHLSDYPSAHCIVERDVIDTEDIKFACDLIESKSKYAKNKKQNKYCYTQVKNLKKTKKAGEVVFLKKPEYVIY